MIFVWSWNFFCCFWLKVYFLFTWLHSQCSFNVSQRCKNKRWKWQRCFDVAYRSSYQRCKSCNFVNLNVDINNVVWTLIWGCATSRRHINLKTKLKQHWKVCWECFEKHLWMSQIFIQSFWGIWHKNPWKVNEKESMFLKVAGVNWCNFAKNAKKKFSRFFIPDSVGCFIKTVFKIIHLSRAFAVTDS